MTTLLNARNYLKLWILGLSIGLLVSDSTAQIPTGENVGNIGGGAGKFGGNPQSGSVGQSAGPSGIPGSFGQPGIEGTQPLLNPGTTGTTGSSQSPPTYAPSQLPGISGSGNFTGTQLGVVTGGESSIARGVPTPNIPGYNPPLSGSNVPTPINPYGTPPLPPGPAGPGTTTGSMWSSSGSR